jgi:hypothetical protein
MEPVSARRGIPIAVVFVFVSVIVSAGLFSQGRQNPKISWIGHITSIEPWTIHASSGPQETPTNLRITLAPSGKVWRKTTRNDFSALRVGDEISVRGYRLALGELQATDIWANIDKVFGRITDVHDNQIRVLLSNPEPHGEMNTVTVDGDTVTECERPLPMSDVQKGRFIEAIGLRMPDGSIAATRATVFVDKRPVCMPPDVKIIDPQGNPVRK